MGGLDVSGGEHPPPRGLGAAGGREPDAAQGDRGDQKARAEKPDGSAEKPDEGRQPAVDGDDAGGQATGRGVILFRRLAKPKVI